MTVLLGRQIETHQTDRRRTRRPGLRTDDSWDDRCRRYRQALQQQAYPTWQPLPTGPRHQPAVDGGGSEPVPETSQVGMLELYAGRVRRQPKPSSSPRRIASHERALVCGGYEPGVQRRTLAVISDPVPLGRGSQEHYLALHPRTRPAYGRLRCGDLTARPREIVLRRKTNHQARKFRVHRGMQAVLYPLIAGSMSAPVHGTRRVLIGAVAALIVLASAATSGFAGQQRYEVRDGDTVDSVAATFGVDPASIRSSSYLPTGDDLQAGQVIVIPEPGQSPTDAAQMAAANEGTSPWVATAHWVVAGDTVGSIAATYGVSPESIIEFNAITDTGNLLIGSRLLIPAGGSAVESASVGQPDVAVANMTGYSQQRNLSCEYAAAHIATGAFNNAIPEEAFMAAIPQASNPHYGYRGNIDGWWGNTVDYGIYPEPLVPVLNAWGFTGEVMYTGGDTAPLVAHIDAGHPVMVWLGFWGDTRETLTDQDSYSVFAGMHVVTVYGYDSGGVHVADPATGGTDYYTWDVFIGMWSVIDGMSLAVYPQ